MAILAAAGDIGGVRALAPALERLSADGGKVYVWDHRDLPAALPAAPKVKKIPPDARCTVFSTSVADPVPLQLARRSRAAGLRVECVLDSWMNYRRRLEMDGGALFVPDAYHVMDALARSRAIGDGLPAEVVFVSGHPGLADLAAPAEGERLLLRRRIAELMGYEADRGLIAWVSEPAGREQAAGYTEEQALGELCAAVRASSGHWAICVLAHPREDRALVQVAWARRSLGLAGGVLPPGEITSREALAAAHAVGGMTSILLYESWLIGRPTLSLQPGLARPDLRIYRDRPGVFCVETPEEMERIGAWLEAAKRNSPRARAELEAHRGAAERLAGAWRPYSL
ncbi:MAG: hypothetical protein ACT4P4_28300 [Betaproteobacteria bacterium]